VRACAHALFPCVARSWQREAIATRQVIVRTLGVVAQRGNEEVVKTLLACVEKDNCFEVRQPAMALLAQLASPEDERVMALALEHLRKKDLRYESIQICVNICGNVYMYTCVYICMCHYTCVCASDFVSVNNFSRRV